MMDKLMKLNIQMFAEEADNATEDFVEEAVDTEIADGEEIVEETIEEETIEEEIVDEKKIRTKAFSERLNQEKRKMEEAIRQEQENKLNAIAKSRGFDSWEELEAYDEQQKLERLGVVDHDEFKSLLDEIVSKNPTVKKAQEILKQQEEERKNVYIKTQIAEISALDSDIKTIDDLVKLDRYDEFKTRLDKGYELADAYKAVYFDKIKMRDAESVKQRTLNNLENKSHLKTAGGKSSTDVHIPSDILAMYKKNLPKLTEAEIRKHYAKYVKGE